MRSVPFDLVIYEDEHAKPSRWGRDGSRRSGGVPHADEPAAASHRSLAWLTGFARRRQVAAGRAAA